MAKRKASAKTVANVPTKRARSKKTGVEEKTGKEIDVATVAIDDKGEPVKNKQAEAAGDEDEAKFKKFKELPLEIRNKIWGFAVPEPCVVVQWESKNANTRFQYIRDGGKVPAVLHACKESREEFLEKNDGEHDPTLDRRRRNHPVYKLSFIDQSRTHRYPRPVFFAADYDSFWGQPYGYSRTQHDSLVGVGQLDIAPNLKHLVWKKYIDIEDALRHFPKLETVTLLLDDERAPSQLPFSSKRIKITMGPEVNGRLDESALVGDDLAFFNVFWGYVQRNLAQWVTKPHNFRKPFPRFKYRFERQFIENERIELPAEPTVSDEEFDSDSD
ncbi:hypothetical protein N431DRAFT_481233 [Stipitochalara longipes BDJ]|nr:hypothetical protein N431DRAFT_481233 [Stipitochalara longipes BDJ]